MNIYDFLFIAGFLGIIAISGYKMYNIMHRGEKYDIKVAFLLFILTIISWFVCHQIFLIRYTKTLYQPLQMFTNAALIMGLLFFFIEVMFFLSAIAIFGQKPMFSNERRLRRL